NAPGAPVEAVESSATRAAIHDEIEALPMKYETVVTEGGGSFSGGQRQRLALARALVHGPRVLLLDEATSALDNLTQARIESHLGQLGCTRIVIAHRLATIVTADLILVLDRGRLVESGTHEELIARGGRYSELFRGDLT